MATLSTRWKNELPALRTLIKNKIVRPKRAGFMFKCVRQLVECHDQSYPFSLRLRGLGNTLSNLNQFVSIDLELLSWLAAARWLARNNSFHLATLSLKEYLALSMRLSDGKKNDVLLIAGDLIERSWFLEGSEN